MYEIVDGYICFDCSAYFSWWRQQMETFSALLALCAGNSPVHSPHKGQWRGTLMFFICAWTNSWVNNQDAGDLRQYRAHYGVTVMYCPFVRNDAMKMFNWSIIVGLEPQLCESSASRWKFSFCFCVVARIPPPLKVPNTISKSSLVELFIFVHPLKNFRKSIRIQMLV